MMLDKYKQFVFFAYLFAIVILTIVPLGFAGRPLNNTEVLSLRLDYLLHALVFLPLVSLWKLYFPGHPLWVIVPAGLMLAALAEISHLFIPYRGYNLNDLMGNILGVVFGVPVYYLLRALGIYR